MNLAGKRLSSTSPSYASDRIATFFKERRIAAGVSIAEVELKLGIPTGQLAKYEAGGIKFPLDEIYALTNFLNIPPEDVLSLIFDLTAGVRK